jgi:hypothetical protein
MSCGCLYRNEIIGELQKSLIKKSDFRNIFECDRDYTNVDDRFFLIDADNISWNKSYIYYK